MPGCEEKKRGGEQPAAAILITSFKPRQVLLSSTSKPNMKQQLEKDKKSTVHLTSEQRVLLYHSICQFLEINGLLKTLKKFRHETHVEKDSWKSCSLNLEEICQEHLQKRSNANAKVLNVKQKDDSANHDVSVETVERTKENGADDGKKFNTMLENNPLNGDYVKSKKKKNTKANDLSNHLNGETHLNEADHPVEDIPSLPSEPEKKSKEKKKKHKHESEPLDKELVEKQAEVAAGKPSEKEDVVSQKEKSKIKKRKEEISIQKDEADKEKKESKKRKKSSSNDNDTGHVEETPFDDFKRRRTDNLDQSNGTDQAPKTPKGSANGVLENDEGKKYKKKNKTKERDDSAQPKTANAFQRVKADKVEFADERLQDNSYWAKDGADSGYGAKAQEVLGQVRGRDFRHEKTKKKRGSYRGGQIDLQSHSVKFNYDDDDE